MNKKPTNTDEYISGFPEDVQKKLWQFLELIRKAAPKAEEAIGYGMPLLKLNGRLVYFAGYKKHIGFYPMPSAIKAFQEKLAPYVWAKGSVRFPLDKPLPVSLIKEMVKFRVKENMAKEKIKRPVAKKAN